MLPKEDASNVAACILCFYLTSAMGWPRIVSESRPDAADAVVQHLFGHFSECFGSTI